MEAQVNPGNVGKEFQRLIEENLDFDEHESVKFADTAVAEFLYDKFARITCKYRVKEEWENFSSSEARLQRYLNREAAKESEDLEDIEDDPDWVFEDECGQIKADFPPNYVTIKQKERILDFLDNEGKNWSFQAIKNRYPALRDRSYKSRWRDQVREGGTKYEKYQAIDAYVWTLFEEARASYKCVRDIDLRSWVLQKSREYPDFPFKASQSWATNFKSKHNLGSRKIQKVVSHREIIDLELLQASASAFRQDVLQNAPKYGDKYVWNTDQVGINYEILPSRTISYKGEKATFGSGFSPKNRATHSFTVQPIISLEGKIIGDFFVCLQEVGGKMGPKVLENVFHAPNITLTCSSSGKLTKSHIEYFLDKVVLPSLDNREILLTFNHWSAQLDVDLYTSRFGKDKVPECKIITVPEKCTAICQPCDTGFNREFKYLLREIHSYAALHSEVIEPVSDRNSCLKAISLAHFVLSSPVFIPLIRHAWFKSGLLTENPQFQNVRDVCFRSLGKTCGSCNKKPFIKCSWCEIVICFDEFFHDYHVMICSKSPYLQTETYERFKKPEYDQGTSDLIEPGPNSASLAPSGEGDISVGVSKASSKRGGSRCRNSRGRASTSAMLASIASQPVAPTGETPAEAPIPAGTTEQNRRGRGRPRGSRNKSTL